MIPYRFGDEIVFRRHLPSDEILLSLYAARASPRKLTLSPEVYYPDPVYPAVYVLASQFYDGFGGIAQTTGMPTRPVYDMIYLSPPVYQRYGAVLVNMHSPKRFSSYDFGLDWNILSVMAHSCMKSSSTVHSM